MVGRVRERGPVPHPRVNRLLQGPVYDPPGFSRGPISGDGFMPRVTLSFDVEEHFRIEAAAGLAVPPSLKLDYARRMEDRTRLILDRLAARRVKATFFVVGEIAHTHPALVRDIAAAGHEVASHSWDHRRVHRFDPATFGEDLRKSKIALEQ